MKKLSLCRICLAGDMRLRLIVGTHLQEMYESLVIVPLETEDSRPVMACYICLARLQNCYELRRSCLQSEELFTQLLSYDGKPVTLQVSSNNKRLSIVHPVMCVSLGDDPDDEMNSDTDGGAEATEMFDDVEVKQELVPEHPDDSVTPPDTKDYYVPLNIIKTEQDDVPSVPTSKKPKTANIQRNLEDATSTNHEDVELAEVKGEDLKGTAIDATVRRRSSGDVEATSAVSDSSEERFTSEPQSKHKQYTCDTCQESFSCKYNLERHVRLCSDEGNKSESNRTCDKLYKCNKKVVKNNSLDTLSKYVPTNVKKPYQCTVCNKCFTYRCYLTMHMYTHTGERPHQCTVCNKSFMKKSHLKEHMQTHTSERPHQCNACNKGFIKKNNYKKHMQMHTGEKPHECNICNKCFISKCSLVKHMCTHTGEKPFHCNVCNKGFLQKYYLKTHMQRHIDEKLHQCSVCHKGYTRKRSLKEHMRRHRGEK